MTPATEHRKLVAIMFTDMVGYSALAQRNEKLAHELLEEHRALLRSVFPRFNGTEIKTIGDAFLVGFLNDLEGALCGIKSSALGPSATPSLRPSRVTFAGRGMWRGRFATRWRRALSSARRN